MAKFLILADDFTGALDASVQFVETCARIKVLDDNGVLDMNAIMSTSDVLVVHTNSRHVTSKTAYETIRCICEKMQQYTKEKILIYKKTDSALRGSIGAELDAVLEGGNFERLFFVPAYPKLDRITKQGIHYVDGVPVSESPFAVDPLNPVKTSFLPDVIHQSSKTVVRLVSEEESLMRLDLSAKGIYVFDATTEKRLQEIAAWMRTIHVSYAMAGCAGFAKHVASFVSYPPRENILFGKSSRPMIVLGTVHSLTMKQVQASCKRGYRPIHVTDFPGFKEKDYKVRNADVEMILDLYQRGGKLILMTRELPSSEEIDPSNPKWKEEAAYTAASFGKLIEGILKGGFCGVMVISGGDTLYGVLTTLGCLEIEPVDIIEEGVVYARVKTHYGELYIVTKSGGMGSENVFEKIEAYLLAISQKERIG